MTETRAVINVDINTAGAAAELRRLQSQLNAFQSTLSSSNRIQSQGAKNLSLQLREAVNATQMFSAETVRMRTSAGRLDDALSKGKGSISQYFNSFRKGSTEAAQVMSLAHARASALQTQFVATGAAAGGYREALAIRPLSAFNATATVSAEKLGIQRAMLTQASTQMINFGKNTQWAGRQLMVGFTVPLTIFGTIAGKTYMELEKQAISFKKVYGDSFTTPQELQENLDAVKVLSEEYTKFGIAASKTMELAAQAAAMGAQGATLTDAITESTKLATLGQMEQTEALETTIALQNAFGLSGEKLAKSVNFLNMVENQTVLTLQDLAEAIPRVSPVIKGLGGTVEDMAAMLAAMKEGGVSAAQGANALKSGLASLINPTDKAVERLKEMGINLETIIRVNRGDLLGTVQAFGKALSTLDEFGRQQALEKVFGKYQYARLGALFNNIVKDGTQASRVLDMASMSAKELNDVAEKELKVISDSPATRMTAAIEKLKLSIAPLGEMFIKFAIPVVELFTRILKIFDGLPDGVKKIGAIGAIIVGVVIPAGTMFLGLLLNLMGTLVKFGHIVGVTFKGFLTGGISGAIKAVSQSLKYMSLAEIDAAGASMQLGESTLFVNTALRNQVSEMSGVNAGIIRLTEAYAVLRTQMQMTAAASPVVFGIGDSAAVAASMAPSRAVPPRRLRRNSGGSIPYLSNGNTVPGSGNTDTVPAMLTPGEFVINKKATEKNLPLLYAINDGNTPPGFNKGGQIPGVQYAGVGNLIGRIFGKKPKTLKPASDYDTPPTAEETAKELALWPQRPVRPMAYQSQAVATAGKSRGIYGDLTEKYLPGTNSKVDTLRFMVDKLGFSPAALGLQSHGNFVLGFSKSTNLAMAGRNPTLTRERLLAELVDSNGQVRKGVYLPLEQQMSSYFGNGQAFDHDLFDNIFRGQVALSKEPISNKRFEKISRNALREYLRARDYSGPDSRSFIKDILSKDTVRGNASKTAILSSLTARGIPYETNGKDVIATIDGVRYNFGSVAGREMGSLGRPEGIRPYGDLEMSPGAERVHANKGGLLGRLGMFRGLFSTQGGLPGLGRGRVELNEQFKQISDEQGLNTANLNMKGSSSGAGKSGPIIPGLSLNRGHIASGLARGENTYHPGLMFWQTRGANQGLTRGEGLTGQQLLNDFNLIERSGMYPPSLMIAGARRLGLSNTTQEDSIKEAYAQIKKMLENNPTQYYNNKQLTEMTEQILKTSLEPKLFKGLYQIGTTRNSAGKSIGTDILEQNQGGMIPGMQYFAARIPRRVVMPAKEYPGFGTLSPEGAVPRPRLSVPPSPLPRAVGSMTYKDWIGKKVSTPLGEGIVIYAKPNLTGAFSLKIKRKHGTGTMSSNDVSIIDDEQLGINGYAHGGQIFESGPSKKIVPGVGNTDTVPAMLTPGEFVINKKATSQNMALLHSINNGSTQAYAKGGIARYARGGLIEIGQDTKGLTLYKNETGEIVYGNDKRPAPGRIPPGLQTPDPSGPRPRRFAGMGMQASMGMGTIGGAMMMAPMIPGIGENAALSGALSIGGTALSAASVLPMLGGMLPATAAAALAGIAPVAIPLIATIGAVTAAFVVWRRNVDESARASAELGANMGKTSNALNVMGKLLGQQTPAQRSMQLQMGVSSKETEILQSPEMQGVLSSEEGQKIVTDLKDATSGERFKKLSDYLKSAIAAGMMDKTQASSFAKAIGMQLGDVALGTSVSSSIRNQKTGSGALLALAEERKAAQGTLEAKPGSDNSSKIIGGGLQVIQDFSNAEALAREEFSSGKINFEEMNKVVQDSRETQKLYTQAIEDALKATSDFGGTMQATKDQLLKMGVSEEQYAALEKSATSVQAVAGYSRGGIPATLNKELFAGASAAVAGGMNADIATKIVDEISNKSGSLFDSYTSAIASGLDQKTAIETAGATEQLTGKDGIIKEEERAITTLPNGKTISKKITSSAKQEAESLLNNFVKEGGSAPELNAYLGGISEGNRNKTVSFMNGLKSQEARQAMVSDSQSLAQSIDQPMIEKLQMSDAYKQGLSTLGGTKTINTAITKAKEAGVSENVLNYAINTKSNGQDATPEALAGKINELRISAEAINQLPEEMLIGLDIDITDPKDLEKYGPMVKQLQGYTKILENLNPNIDMIASMKFLTMGNDGELLDPEQVAKNTIILNKAWNNLSSKNKNTRLQAVRQLLISTQDENGNQLDPDQVDASYNDLVDKFGGKIMNLEPDIINKLVFLQIEIEGIDESIAALKAAQVLTSPDQAERIQTQIDVLQAAKKTKLAAQRVAISTPSTGGGGGGGGGEKSIPQQLKKEFNDLKKVHNSMQQFINSKKGQFKGIMAGPFGPEFIEYLKSQGEQGLKVLNGGINKIKAAYEAFKKVRLQNMSNFAQSFPATMIKQTQDIAIKNAFTKRLDKNGFDAETSDQFIEGMGGVDAIRAYNEIKKKDKGKRTEDEKKAFKDMNKAIAQGGSAVKEYLSASTFDGARLSLDEMNKELNNTNKLLNLGYTQEEAEQIANLGDVSNLSAGQINKLGDSVKAYNLAVLASDPEALAQMKRDNAAEIRDINRQIDEINLIRPLEDQVEIQQKIIDGQEKIVRGKQQEIDIIQRNIELKQRELEPLDDQIEKLQELSDKTSEAYDNQIEALDQIYKREDNIAKLKQGQLGVAQALSRGDVAGAAQGALGMSQEIAQQSREEARSALEAQKEAATKNIQDQILAIEKQKKAINQDIKNLQMQQRVIQDEIYTIQSTKILPAENKIYDLQIQINDEADKLATKYTNAAGALENLRARLKALQKDQDDLTKTPGANAGEEEAAPADQVAPAPPAASSSNGPALTTGGGFIGSSGGPNGGRGSNSGAGNGNATTQQVKTPAQLAESRRLQAAAANAAAAQAAAAAAKGAAARGNTRVASGSSAAAAAQANKAAQAAAAVQAAAVAANRTAVAKKSSPRGRTFGGLMSYNNGGMMKKYAYGSMVPGMGMTDKVPALLTPGEFVIRKSVVESYGPMLSNLNSQVFPKMNMTSAMPSTEGNENEGTVYNYQVSVALNGSNLDPNDVANAVMQKIKMSESRNIRSNNIRG